MPSRLIRSTPFPPSEFVYEQAVNGKVIKWKGDGLDLKQQAERVSAFRAKNGLPRASVAETMDDIDLFTCARLGGMSAYCSDADSPRSAVQVARHGCSGCGAKIA